MQLLRDNLTLWTSSDGNEAEAADSSAPKEEKPAEAEAAAPVEQKSEEAPAAAPAAAAGGNGDAAMQDEIMVCRARSLCPQIVANIVF